jgi:DNA-binding transcriptional MerR regulator
MSGRRVDRPARPKQCGVCDPCNVELRALEVSTLGGMGLPTVEHTYTITEAATLSGLPASTLRYYESIGVIAPISRGRTSRHRVFTEDDLDQLMWVACLAATGMSVTDMRQYVANGALGPSAAKEQVVLLQQQKRQLVVEAEQIALRRRYVELKINYWQAVGAGDRAQAEALSDEARALADELARTKKQ